MNRNVYFNSPFLLGFEHLERLLERTAKSAGDGYPPYNIEQASEDKLRITLAVAGFAREELALTIEGRQLVIRGKQAEERPHDYIYRGIAARRFKRSFGLADGVEVRRAELHNGLLAIEIERPVKESTVKTVRIANGETAIKAGAARQRDRVAIFDAE